jgi:hypothetical protein
MRSSTSALREEQEPKDATAGVPAWSMYEVTTHPLLSGLRLPPLEVPIPAA